MEKTQPIVCLNTGVVYPTQGDAARTLGIDKGLLSNHLAGKRVTANGLTFVKLRGNETQAEIEKVIADGIKKHFKVEVEISVSLSERSKTDG